MKRISDLMADVEWIDVYENEVIDREALERMKRRTLQKIPETEKSRWRSLVKPLAACAAVLLLVVGAYALDLDQIRYMIFSRGEEQELERAEDLDITLPDRLGEYTLRDTNVRKLSASEKVPSEGMKAEYTTLSFIYLPEEDSEVDMTTWNTLALEAGKMEGELWAWHFGFDPETKVWSAWPEHPGYPGLTYSEPEVVRYEGRTLYLSQCTFTVQETDETGTPTGALKTTTDWNVLWLNEEKNVCFRLTVHELAELDAIEYAKEIIDNNQ